jgi:hypothetical protein
MLYETAEDLFNQVKRIATENKKTWKNAAQAMLEPIVNELVEGKDRDDRAFLLYEFSKRIEAIRLDCNPKKEANAHTVLLILQEKFVNLSDKYQGKWFSLGLERDDYNRRLATYKMMDRLVSKLEPSFQRIESAVVTGRSPAVATPDSKKEKMTAARAES